MLSSGNEFTGREVVNPFSDAFAEKWAMWLMYKKEVHRFEYKHPMTEQAALNQLVDLSEGDEDHAWRIMNQSMANSWKGFFKVHNPKKDKKNGEESTSQKKTTGRATGGGLRAIYGNDATGTEG